MNKVLAKTSRLIERKISLRKQNGVRSIESEIYKCNAQQSLNVYKIHWLNKTIKKKQKEDLLQTPDKWCVRKKTASCSQSCKKKYHAKLWERFHYENILLEQTNFGYSNPKNWI